MQLTNKGKTYNELKKFGVFDLMPNGFNVYLDDEELIGTDDSEFANLMYDMEENVYKTLENKDGKVFVITSEELSESLVTYIGSDPMGDFVPALWIVPTDVWYEKNKGNK